MSTQSLTLKKIILIMLLLSGLLVEPTSMLAQTPSNNLFGIVDSFANTPEATIAGATWTRIFLRWDVIQPGGPSDWKPANVPDPLLDAELIDGREIVGVLLGTPSWATEQGTSTAVPPLELWGEFVFRVATQYQGRIKRWVIWHQPDVTDPTSPNYSWDGTVEDYYQLLKVAHQKIKAVDPTMQVHLAGLTHTPTQTTTPYLTSLLDVIGADPEAANQGYFFDVVSYHVYYDSSQLLTLLPNVKTILNGYGLGNKPIWINELNAPPSEDYLEAMSGVPTFGVTLEEQSSFVIQALALALANGADRVAFNKLRNETYDSLPYGLLRGDNSRRPAFYAFQTASTYLTDFQRVSSQQIGGVIVITFEQSGQTTTVLWNTTREPLLFDLNAIASEGVLVDPQNASQSLNAHQGRYAIDLPGAVCSNGDYCFIGGAPRLLVENGSAAQRTELQPIPTSTPFPTATPTTTNTPQSTPTNIPPALPPPTLTPSATSMTVEPLSPTPFTTPAPVEQATSQPEVAALPDPDFEPPILANELMEFQQAETAVTPIPEVTLLTVLTPNRLLWLFLIGVIVFTGSYGVQVAIWYRLRK